MHKGIVSIYISLIFALIITSGVIYLGVVRSRINSQNNSVIISPTQIPSPTIIPTASPTMKPIPTKVPIPKLSIVPTSTTTDCSKFKPEDGLATISITLKEKDGKPLFGDWAVEIKHAGTCPAILPYGDQQLNTVIKQGTYTFTSAGFHPGQVRVDVKYHYTGEGLDIDAVSGNTSREVTVSN